MNRDKRNESQIITPSHVYGRGFSSINSDKSRNFEREEKEEREIFNLQISTLQKD